MLSMSLVFFIVVWVYLPKDSNNTGQRAYIPKRHRKWARFRSKWIQQATTAIDDSVIGRSISTVWKTATKSSFCKKREFRRCRSTLLNQTTRTSAKVVQNIIRQTSILVNENEDAPSGQEILQCTLIPLISARMSSKGERYLLTIFAAYLYFCGLQCYDNEMKGKARTLSKLVETSTATSRGAVSLSTWVDIAVTSFDLFSEHVECCEITRAATITYVVVGGLTIMQNCLSGSYTEDDKAGRKEEADDEDNYYDCCQSHEEQINAELETLTFMPATLPNKGRKEGQPDLGFDSDSYWMAVDNCCSACISNCLADFVGPTRQVIAKVKGIGGSRVVATRKGVLRWRITDDDGKIHTFLIKDSYYHETSPYRLLSPQHLAQVCYDDGRGTWCGTYGDGVDLHWDHNKFHRSIPLNESNIALMRSAPGYDSFAVFSAQFEELSGEEILTCLPAAAVSDNEQSDSDDDEMDPDETRGETVEQETDRLQGKTRRHPDLPDDVFTDNRATSVKDVDSAVHAAPPDEEWLQFIDDEGETEEPEVHIIPEDEEVQSKSPQADFLAWHYRLGHVSFEKIRQLSARGDLPASFRNCRVPKCAACLFGKARRRAWRSRAPVNKMKTPPVTAPGSVVAMDQMVSALPGFIAQMRGFITGKRYKVITVFVDQFSDLSFVYTQKSTTAEETVQAKEAFERYAKTHGVTVKHYHADNGIFAEAEFVRAVEKASQTISFCGVNAHHMNGHAEKRIRDLQENARAMLLHAKRRWPSAVTAHLWPYAVRMANEVHNFSPSIKEGISPIERFSQVQVSPKVRHCHTFGCPVYVLDGKLQSGQPLPKWDDRARIGLFLGWSPRHGRKVALVLNLSTGHVSPQFHVVFDDLFETLRPSAGNDIPKSLWQQKAGFVLEDGESAKTARKNKTKRGSKPMSAVAKGARNGEVPNELPQEEEEGQGDESFEQGGQTELPSPDDDETEIPEGLAVGEAASEATAPTFSRAGRAVRPTTRWQESLEQQKVGLVALLAVPWEVFHDDGYKIQEEMENPIAFVASTNPDIMYLDEAMRQPDRVQFQKAMIEEVKTHTENGHWKIISREEVPKGTPVLPSVWAMRRKRRIATQEVYKWKARLNLHGGKQEYGLNYWETYSPVVTWATVRLFLVLVLLNKWTSRQVDFVLAYPQADIECPLYMEIPRGFQSEGSRKKNCLLLEKNIYGQRQAGRVWNQYLHEGLVARGFRQSKVDMCLYYRGKVALLFYVDDGIFLAPRQKDIDEAYKLLSAPVVSNQGEVLHRAFVMTDEGDLSDYLGVKIDALPNGTIKVSQPHLIQSVLDDLKFNERTGTKKTPASTSVKLNGDIHGEPFIEEWQYRGVIGKLNFIEKSTRPDIAYAVHQCARFSADPKNSHATAVKRIGKYLLATKDKGMILNPKSHSFDCWVDADFVGNWDRVYADVDPGTAKSRAGYIITYGACPIIWGSKLMQEVALSTAEAEYGAISMSLRDVIFLMQLLEETAKELKWETSKTVPKVHCKLFEDNSGALEMARLPKMRPRTKHLCVKMHHFREHVRKGKVSIHKIPTRFQLGDIATKAQPEALFVSQRESLLQWEAETMTRKELTLPAKHLRACDISDSSEALCIDQHADAFRVESKPTPVVIDPATVRELISRVRRTQARVEYFKAVDKPVRAVGSQKASASTGKAIASTAMATASTAMAKASTIKASKKTTMIPLFRGGK